ncbi:MAG TPA: hypothetical protein VFA92_02820 [Candidatus Binatia bacterium]|nr:hypothetical protein [Candidatus Binatia bacterium]
MSDLLSLAVVVPPTLDTDPAILLARLAGRLGYAAVHVSAESARDGDFVEALARAADPAIVVVDDTGPARGLVRVNDPEQVAAVRRAMNQEGVARPLLVAVPVSIGRTMNEAVARADREPRFAGDRHPRVSGIFGTFEQAQEQVLALARAGADGLVVDVPVELDFADVLAQVKALVVGATPALLAHPGSTEKD